MPRKVNSLPFFLTFFILSILLIILGSLGLFSGISGVLNSAASPVRNATFSILTLPSLKNKTIAQLNSENDSLRQKLVNQQKVSDDNKALRDQFAVAGSNSLKELPVKVVGENGFVPGVSAPQYLIIDQGSNSGLYVGLAVVLGNNLVGEISQVFSNNSTVILVTNGKTSFTGKVQNEADTNGVVKGTGSGLILDNVVLSKTLRKGDLVLTKGDVSQNGSGYPPDLVVGKIVSIEKKPSDLFQKAEVQSLVNFENLTTVFVLK